MLENATRICGAGFGTFRSGIDESTRWSRSLTTMPACMRETSHRPRRIKPRPGSTMERVVRSRDVVHVVDLLQRLDAPGDAGCAIRRCTNHLGDAHARRRTGRCHRHCRRGAALHRQADRAGAEFRRPGGHRYREHAAAQRIAPTHRGSERVAEQQTATSEVLRVISASPGDLEPVFRIMLQNAARICAAKAGNIYRWEDDGLRLVASHNTPSAFVEFLRRTPLRATANNPVAPYADDQVIGSHGRYRSSAAVH